MPSRNTALKVGGHVAGRRVRWEEHKRERRQLIIDAAIAVIEEHPPGTTIHVQQIAERAGLGDRSVARRAGPRRCPAGHRGAGHPAHRRGLRDLGRRASRAAPGRGPGGGRRRRRQSAASRSPADRRPRAQALRGGRRQLGITLDADDLAALDPFIFGLVAQAVGPVRHWLARPERTPSAPAPARRMADSVWFLIDGHARARGGVIDPSMNLEEIVARLPS